MILKNGIEIDDADSWVTEVYYVSWHRLKNTATVMDPKTKKRRVLARILLGAPQDKFVDHIDGNPQNNKRSNLRLATQSENNMNKRKKVRHKLPKGVYIDKRCPKKPYYVQVTKNRKTIVKGYFATMQEAVDTYNKIAKELHGEFHRPSEMPKNS